MRWPIIIAFLAAPAATATSSEDPVKSTNPEAAHKWCSGDTAAPPAAALLSGYGGGGFPIRTSEPMAQAFFDNGMQLAAAFAHKAAIGAMAEAVRRDPACAMCLWGEAWVSGPTINYNIDPEERAELARKVEQAGRLAAKGTEKEQALIAALALRYGANGKKPSDRHFAEAMDALARRYSGDDQIVIIAADAWMTLDSINESPAHLPRAIELIEHVLRRSPDYTPAIHFYIHATEIAGFPEHAERFADRLPALAPAASHLIHMPSHTYFHIGRYQDAVNANMRAVEIGKANARRLGLGEPEGVWGLPYHAHNVQYGVGAALISGDGSSALALSDPLIARVTAGRYSNPGIFSQMIAGTAYFAKARFDAADAMLSLPAPPAAYPYALAYYHYARGEAAARLGHAEVLRAEAAAMKAPRIDKQDFAGPAAVRMIAIGRRVLEGRAAMLASDPKAALSAFRKAAKLQEAEDFVGFADPPAFWYPVRRDVASALFAMGKTREALAEVEATLRMMPEEPATKALRAKIAARTKGAMQG